jgi:hypothetical protein
MDARLQDLPFDPAALRRLSPGLVASHHQNNYGVTILALDMYEHADHMDDGAASGACVDAFMDNVDCPKVALLYPGDRAARDRADPAASRFAALFEALAAAGVNAEPAVYHDDFAAEVMAQLRERGGLARDRLPLPWGCDCMLGEGGAGGAQRFVLCEISGSGVSPFPRSPVAPLVKAVRCRTPLSERPSQRKR